MTYRLEIFLMGLPPSNNARLHHMARHQQNIHWKGLVWRQTRKKLPPAPLEKAKLTVTFCSAVPRDHDNIIASVKPILDGLVVSGVLEDDKIVNIGFPEYRFEKVKRKDAGVRVVVEEALP